MGYYRSDKSITHKVLNESTGELEPKTFNEESELINIKGGYVKMYYKNYDEVMIESIKSNLDTRLFVRIREHFTYDKKEALVSPSKIAEDYKTSRQNVTKFIEKLVELKFIMRVGRSEYRLNPFMYIPYKAKGDILQKEWDELIEAKTYGEET